MTAGLSLFDAKTCQNGEKLTKILLLEYYGFDNNEFNPILYYWILTQQPCHQRTDLNIKIP